MLQKLYNFSLMLILAAFFNIRSSAVQALIVQFKEANIFFDSWEKL